MGVCQEREAAIYEQTRPAEGDLRSVEWEARPAEARMRSPQNSYNLSPVEASRTMTDDQSDQEASTFLCHLNPC